MLRIFKQNVKSKMQNDLQSYGLFGRHNLFACCLLLFTKASEGGA